MEYLLQHGDGGPCRFNFGQLCLWSLGCCIFGVVFAIPLRCHFILRERLPFPSGTATAVLLGILYGDKKVRERVEVDRNLYADKLDGLDDSPGERVVVGDNTLHQGESDETASDPDNELHITLWKRSLAIISLSFTISSITVRRTDHCCACQDLC